jgi:hypothetical protein
MPCRRRRRILTQVQLKTDHHAKINHGTALRIVNRIFSVIALVAFMLPKVAGGQQESAPAGASPQHNPGLFVDATAAKGLNFRYLSSHTSKKYLVETMGAGVALFDYDNDGRLDIFLVNGAQMACLIWLSCAISNGTSTTRGARAQGRLPDPLPSGLFQTDCVACLSQRGQRTLYRGVRENRTGQAGQRVGHRVPSAAPDGRDAEGPAQISGATGFSGHRADIPSDGSPSRP